MNLKTLYLCALEDPSEKKLFNIYRIETIQIEIDPKSCCVYTHKYDNVLFRNKTTNSEEPFIDEKR